MSKVNTLIINEIFNIEKELNKIKKISPKSGT